MRDRREALSTLAVALAAVAVQLPIYDRGLALLDEGYLLALAEEIARGKLLYRDVYVDNPFPGAFYLVAAWLQVAGTSIWASRLLALGAFALFTTLLFRAARARAFVCGAGPALAPPPPPLYFAARGALGPLREQSVVRPLRVAAPSRYVGLPPLLPLLHQDAVLRTGIGSYFPAILLTLGERWSAIHAGWLYRETAVWDVLLKLLFYAPFVVWGVAALRWA